MLRTLKLWVCVVVLLSAAPAAHGSGKIIVAHDEWPLSDWGFHLSPSAPQFALNIANFFTGGERGRFLVYSPNGGLTGDRLATTMRGAGHEWTIVNPALHPAVDLDAYTGVFVGQLPIDNGTLAAYVLNGGNVYVMAGTGHGLSDSAMWNDFLNFFGLHLETRYNDIQGVLPVVPGHSLFAGVSSLLYVTGNDIRTTGLVPGSRIVQATGSHGLFAVYADDSVLVPMALKASVCGDTVHIRKTSRGQIGVHFLGVAGLTADAIDPSSIRLLGLSPTQFYVADQISPAGIGSSSQCSDRPDGLVDLQMTFDMRKTATRVWSILGDNAVDGDVITLTATGKLKPAYGGRAIRGEANVIIRIR